MTTKEFSDQFDVLYNNVTSNQAPGLNEYEKSVFLTKALDEILKNYFLLEGNPHQKGFDDTLKRLIDFSMLMKSVETNDIVENVSHFDPRTLIYELEDDILFIVNEQFIIYESDSSDNLVLKAMRQVIPITLNEYTRLMSKPYKEPLRYQAWRLITNTASSSNTSTRYAEILLRTADRRLISSTNIIIHTTEGQTVNPSVNPGTREGPSSDSEYDGDTSTDSQDSPTTLDGSNGYYCVRYVRSPKPIILEDFTSTMGEDISIHGVSTETLCELDPILHEEILQRAVELAKVAWASSQEESASAQLVMTAGLRME